MSVEEEEYDIQPGISSVWLVTFSILYIIGKKTALFLMNQFPPSPWVYHEGRFKFLENSWRYWHLKVHYQCHGHGRQMEKIFNKKSFVFIPLDSRDKINFFPSSSL
jgi:hypothetical protein